MLKTNWATRLHYKTRFFIPLLQTSASLDLSNLSTWFCDTAWSCYGVTKGKEYTGFSWIQSEGSRMSVLSRENIFFFHLSLDIVILGSGSGVYRLWRSLQSCVQSYLRPTGVVCKGTDRGPSQWDRSACGQGLLALYMGTIPSCGAKVGAKLPHWWGALCGHAHYCLGPGGAAVMQRSALGWHPALKS